METKKLRLRWRWFTISSFFLIVLSVVAVSRPLGDSALDEISICLPFITLYYILIGFHMLWKYEEKQISSERKI
jgi:bacteriorhodopsin